MAKRCEYGRAPEDLGAFDPDWTEYMHYLYLPVMMPYQPGLRLPERLDFLREAITYAEYHERQQGNRFDYVYVTARRGYASPGNPLNRPGWHADGFGTDDINYIWSDRYPTQFAVQEFYGISNDHVLSVEQFTAQIANDNIVTFPDKMLLRLDPSVIHCTPIIPPPGGNRSFFKISLSNSEYNLEGNSHNHLFDYTWRMWNRDEVRNDPAYAGGDSGPQE